MSGYFKALLFLACALPVSSEGPLFTDVTQDAGIAFVNQSGGADTQHIIETQSAGGFWDYDGDGDGDLYVANCEITWPGGERQAFRAVPADRHYAIHRGVNRLISE